MKPLLQDQTLRLCVITDDEGNMHSVVINAKDQREFFGEES